MFNLEGFIPKLCQLAQELGQDERAQHLRAAGLQALSSMVCSFVPVTCLTLKFHMTLYLWREIANEIKILMVY